MNGNEISEYVKELTDFPWYSWPAHFEARTGYVRWGSDFIMETNRHTTKPDIRAGFEAYIAKRNEHRPGSFIPLEDGI